MDNTHIHSHESQISYGKAFVIGIGLNSTIAIVEIVYGIIANSSALLADGGHNASDVLGLVFAWAATWLATKRPKGRYTYGLRKATVLVSIFNALLIFGAATFIAWDAIKKFKEPEQTVGTQIMIVAAIGVVTNTLAAIFFIKGKKKDLNIKGAFLHMAADAGVSLGVVIAGLLINLTGKQWIDPVISLLIVMIIIGSTWKLFIASIDLALDAVPNNIDIQKVKAFLLEQSGVESIHDLHIWALSTTQAALSVHLVIPNEIKDNFLDNLHKKLEHEFGIKQITIQIESDKSEME